MGRLGRERRKEEMRKGGITKEYLLRKTKQANSI